MVIIAIAIKVIRNIPVDPPSTCRLSESGVRGLLVLEVGGISLHGNVHLRLHGSVKHTSELFHIFQI